MSRFADDDRGVSVAVTHVLTIGITAILISGLLIGSSTLLETERERGATQSLETIGERLAGEIASVDRLAANDTDEINMTVKHPRRVAGSTYSIRTDDTCSSSPLVTDMSCLILSANGENVEVAVPLATDVHVGGSASGGSIAIVYDGSNIRIESGGR